MDSLFPCEAKEQELQFPSFQEIEKIESRIGSERSKKVFSLRLMYALTLDDYYIAELLRSFEEMNCFYHLLDKPTLIYGAGKRGRRILALYPDIRWKGFIDAQKQGDIDNLPIYHLEDLPVELNNVSVVVSVRDGYQEIKKNLEKRGMKLQDIIALTPYIEKAVGTIYFDKRCLRGSEKCDGLFLDVGCYNGTDSLNAKKYFGDDLEIIAFEPDENNFIICRRIFDGMKGVRLLRQGLSAKAGEAFFKEDGLGSRVSDAGDKRIELTTIDSVADGEKVGFIKMDIEGAEEDALEGGRKTICRDHPILALSVYHKRSDIWRLPLKVLEINPEYRLEFEHHTFSWSDTVMYAN